MEFTLPTEYHRYRRYFVNIGQFYRQKKIRIYTEVVLTILTITFFLFFAIKPTLLTITGLVKTIKDERLAIEKLEAKVDSLNLAQKQYVAIEPELYLIDQALPTEPDVSSLVKQLEALGRQSQVTIESLHLSQVTLKGKTPQEEAEKGVFGFDLNVTGAYPNLRNFLQSLSLLRRIILVKSFSFKTGKGEQGTLTLNVSAKANYQPQETNN